MTEIGQNSITRHSRIPVDPSESQSADQDDDRLGSTNTRDELAEAVHKTSRKRFWRFIVGFTILGAGGLVSLATYIYLDRQLKNEAEGKFYVFASTIEDVSRMHFQSMVDSFRDLSLTITAQAESRNWTFPFVTVENWEIHAQQARQRGSLSVIQYAPWVEGESEIAAFSKYFLQNMQWQADSIEIYKRFHPEMKDEDFETNEDPSVVRVDTQGEDGRNKIIIPVFGNGPFVPVYQRSPPLELKTTMIDLYSMENGSVPTAVDRKELLMGSMKAARPDAKSGRPQLRYGRTLRSTELQSNVLTQVIQPIFTSLGDNSSDVAGVLTAVFALDSLLVDLLPETVRGFFLVFENTCGDSFTYALQGGNVSYIGEGDLSDSRYRYLKREIVFDNFYNDIDRIRATPSYCIYKLTVTSSKLYEDDNKSKLPITYCFVVATIFSLMAIAFIIYDLIVEKRNDEVVEEAAISNALVHSIFPSNVHDRFIASICEQQQSPQVMSLQPTKTNLKSFLTDNGGYGDGDNDDYDVILNSKPIADLFSETTIMFADIKGFTAWSSVREPSQVFTLLETVYRAFDKAASKRGVFKVETVGDCYVAVCGLPEPRKDHAVIMARFARDCRQRMAEVTTKLEVILGPDTGDLAMRIGLHSGPVTAGVLRGERSRFQLFGDTMNTASRMESTGESGRIQVSEETAKLLVKAGKQHWVIPRENGVAAKGKGILATYWLTTNKSETIPEISPERAPENCPKSTQKPTPSKADEQINKAKTERLIGWNVEVLVGLLKRIIRKRSNGQAVQANPGQLEYEAKYLMSPGNGTILDEVEEVIRLPHDRLDIARSSKADRGQPAQPNASIELPAAVLDQLSQFVSCIASMYSNHPFHNFEHASHVTMSVVKLLARIVAPSEVDYETSVVGSKTLHDHTYGITSDPLTQFACVLSALIHDVDHPGVPNAQLVKEQTDLAWIYKGKSMAEQNSVQLSWQLLMTPAFTSLRGAIYSSESELKRFRQLIVNSVMATDIVDKELKALRNDRWEKAFNTRTSETQRASTQENVDRKATIVIEHLIQASDVSHTMQHWHVYRKWNERFFLECYRAFIAGRASSDPSTNWYKGEIGFFDFYIIPLAKKLKECGVFGVSSDEYLNYATKNRKEWEERGQDVVAELIEKAKAAEVQAIASSAVLKL